MSKVYNLIDKFNRSAEVAATRLERLDEFLKPILKELGIDRCGVEAVERKYQGLWVKYGWSCRGEFDSSSTVIPYSIIDAEDPILAAKEYVENESRQREEQRKQEIIKKIEQLYASIK